MGTRPGRRKGVAFSPQATPKIRCNERTGAQVGTQRTVAGVSSFSQKAPFASSCANNKVPSSASESQTSLATNQSASTTSGGDSGPHHGVPRWEERLYEILQKQEPRYGRLFSHDKWHSEPRLQNLKQTKGSASGKVRHERLLGIDTMGRHGEESARCQSPPLTTCTTNCLEAQEPFGQVPRVSGECTWHESSVSNHVDYASTSPVLPGSASHCLSLTTPGAILVSPLFAPNCLLQDTLCCSSLKGSSFITGDRQTTTRFAAYSLLSCEQSFGTSQREQRWRSSKNGARLIRSERLAVVGRDRLNWLHGAGLGARDPSVYHGRPARCRTKPWIACGREQSILPPMWRTNGGDKLGAETASSHRWLRRGRSPHRGTSGLEKDLVVWSMRRMSARVLCEKPLWIRASC